MPQIQFFPSARRRVRLEDYRQLEGPQPEGVERKKLTVTMPLFMEDEKVGMPELVGDAWEFLLKHQDARRINFPDMSFKGVTIEAFATPKSKQKQLLMTNCQLNGFYMISEGEEEDLEVYLCFQIYASDSVALHELVKQLFHKDTFLTFEKAQQDLELDNPEGDASKQFAANKRANGHASA